LDAPGGPDSSPVWIGGTLAISCIGAIEVFFNNGNALPTAVWYIVALVFVWTSIVAAITSFSVGKWVPTAGAYGRWPCPATTARGLARSA
jgi:glutamate:GABA antiporter